MIKLFRSDTPSPPNSSKYSELNSRGKNSPKIKSYILKPRQVTMVEWGWDVGGAEGRMKNYNI